MEKDMISFIDTKSDYYMDKHEKMNMNDSKISWNWAAFIFGGYWALYRKMYLAGGLMIIVSWILSIIPWIGNLLSLALWISIGAFGNGIYLEYIQNNLSSIIHLGTDEKERIIRRKGGTSIAIPIIVLIICSIVLPI